ncbi:MAG: hypothetical protein LBF21_01310 [Puniceicoccales bacterium]|jgi:cell division protein FtsB|nr:hypothetical protein [Puniceicoccales bacterium]
MFSFTAVSQKITLAGAWSGLAALVFFMGAQLNSAYREYHHLLQVEEEQVQKLDQWRRTHQQQQAHLQHLLTDEEFFDHIVKQRMGCLHDDEVLFHFEGTVTNS